MDKNVALVLFCSFVWPLCVNCRVNEAGVYDRNPDLTLRDEFLAQRKDDPAATPQLQDVANWPGATICTTIGQQASGVAMNKNNSLVVFHRGNKIWYDKYLATDGPFDVDVFMVIDPTTKTILDQFGAGMIYMPHGLTIDKDDNLWVTDVGAQQVLKIDGRTRTPSLVLGEKFVTGSDNNHFCNPTTVAVVTFSLLMDGATTLGPYALNLPHSLTLDEARDCILVADRETGRIQVYQAGLNGTVAGTYVRTYSPGRGTVFALNYDPIDDVIYVVNGPGLGYTTLEGYTLDIQGHVIDTWKPAHGVFGQPHDLTLTRVMNKINVFVGDVGLQQTQKLWQFVSDVSPQPIV